METLNNPAHLRTSLRSQRTLFEKIFLKNDFANNFFDSFSKNVFCEKIYLHDFKNFLTRDI